MTTSELIHAAALMVETSWEMTPEEFAERLESFIAESTDKLAALRAVCKAAEGRATVCKAEAAAYSAAAKRHSANAERVKARATALLEAAEATGEELPGARLQLNGGVAPLVYAEGFDVNALPMVYWRVEVTPNADAIRKALEAGETLPGVTIGERGRSLRWTEK